MQPRFPRLPSRRVLIATIAGAVVVVAIVFAFVSQIRRTEERIKGLTAAQILGGSKLNYLILGFQPEEGTSDTVIVAHLDIERHTATLVSVPRDTLVAIPGHGHRKLNAAIGYGGPALAAKVVGKLLGVTIDRAIAIAPQGAKQLVDAMGGLNVDVERNMDYDDKAGNLHIHLKKGEQYLTGGQVLAYLRFRNDAEGDWGRMRRQQQVLREIVDQMGRSSQWAKISHLLDLARNDVTTSLSDTQLAALVEVYRGVPQDNVRTLTIPGKPAYAGGASVILVDQRWAGFLGRIIFTKRDPPQDEVTVTNATGIPGIERTITAALRGGGYNVKTFYEQPSTPQTLITGDSETTRSLMRVFPGAQHKPGSATLLRIGTDLVPDWG